MRRLPKRTEEEWQSEEGPVDVRPSGSLPRKGLSCRSDTIGNVMPLGFVLTLSLTCLALCEYTWAWQDKYEAARMG